ncbi:unnamed protein product [Rotaria sordida]|uniref:LolA-like domain-containing protein n=1 Tax=Rotaria sordida TaxID=392033 RepID=A0A814KKP5_9BILA|nr:unnamed protein product [Rotaria sordida]
METSDFFAPPQGTFCPNMEPNLVSLSDSGIEWPLRYTVRIATTTSRGVRPNSLRLRVDNNVDTKRARFDYMIDDENNYETVIIDYREQIKYVIDQTRGLCRIVQGVDWPDVNPETNPIEFFLKLKETILDQPPKNAWQHRGTRLCRGSTMHCVIYTMLLTNYPPMMNPETGMPSGQNWDETHIEYAWSKRDSVFTPQANKSKVLDYPVSLFLRTYQRTTTSTGTEYRSEEIEYEFFEMSTDLPNDGFDVSVCYRSRDWPYLHLAFTVKLNKGNMADSNHLNRKELYDRFLLMLQTAMTPISSTRIHQLEIDHDITSALDTLYVMFLLLGPAPTADPIPSNIPLTTPRPIDQLSVEAAREQLRNPPDHGGLGNIQISSEYIVYVIREMYERANRRRVNIIGHSQGDMTPQWAFRFWSDTRSMVNSMICLAMTNHEIDRQLSDDDLPSWIPARWHFSHGSQVMCALNSFREAFDDQIFYTQIMTCYDNTHYYTA